MDEDGLTLFRPSGVQNFAEDDDQEHDEEDQRDIELQIEARLADMDGDDLNLEDDEDDDSIMGNTKSNDFRHHPNGLPVSGTPFSFGVGSTSSQATAGRIGFNVNEEQRFLYSQHDSNGSQQSLEILYQARGEEIKRLTAELNKSVSDRDNEIRILQHELALLKGDKCRLEANMEHYESVAQGQSDENRELRREIENLKDKLDSADRTKKEVLSQLESSDLMVKTLQMELSSLQKSETILKAKQHHEQVVRSLKDRHETETFNLQQENDRLAIKIKQSENELDNVRSKLSKLQRDHELLMMEKSETIKELQERLESTQKRLATHMAEASSQGYTNIKAIHERYKQDQEKFAADLVEYQEEINSLKTKLKQKEAEALKLTEKLSQVRQESDDALSQKTSTILSLQQRLTDNEKRLNKLMEEGASNLGGNNVLEKYKFDLKKLTEDLEQAHQEILERDTEISSLNSCLSESKEKYHSFKRKVRQYQVHCKSKENKYIESLRSLDEEYRAKLEIVRSKLGELYSSKEKQIEREVLEMKHFFDQELQKLMQVKDCEVNLSHKNDGLADLNNFVEENPHLTSRPLVPMPGNGHHYVSRPMSASAASEELAKMFESVKLDLRDQLKMPHQRQPLSNLYSN